MDIGRHLEGDASTPPLRALFIYNHNPVVVHPDQNRILTWLGTRRNLYRRYRCRDDRKHADLRIVLPAATHFECDDIYGAYGHTGCSAPNR